ncbi:hypothetical protein GCWU000321_01706 [Dialister invisus DSM 15470]|jgi:hypothetical protein|uniref:Uncharacterized protein n=1 Tax=Dialister invisus DSM 15470 TaxID=592028 RepID=C9LQ74_9FIRM|nr:hypothetical protein GCWU000321_01706 [Dialister invisus DSM 15470]
MSLYRLSLKNIWKILIFESMFSVLFCISMAVFLQIAFFSYEAAFILGLAISLIYSLIIYFGGDLFTVKGGIRYIEISIMFFCGLLFITLPVFPFLSDGNILFALFDIICFIGSYIYGSSGVISAIITYILCMWIITGTIYLLQRKIHNRV